jgi:hypothetical protein
MSAVTMCKAYTRRLVEVEARSTGAPIKDCIRAVARRLREPHGSILALMYREPKDVRAHTAQVLAEEVARVISGEIANLENELLAVRLGAAVRTPHEMEEISTDLASLKARVARLKGGV